MRRPINDMDGDELRELMDDYCPENDQCTGPVDRVKTPDYERARRIFNIQDRHAAERLQTR